MHNRPRNFPRSASTHPHRRPLACHYLSLQSFSFYTWLVAVRSSLLHMNNNIWLFRQKPSDSAVLTHSSFLFSLCPAFIHFSVFHQSLMNLWSRGSHHSVPFYSSNMIIHLSGLPPPPFYVAYDALKRKTNFADSHVGILLRGWDHRRRTGSPLYS